MRIGDRVRLVAPFGGFGPGVEGVVELALDDETLYVSVRCEADGHPLEPPVTIGPAHASVFALLSLDLEIGSPAAAEQLARQLTQSRARRRARKHQPSLSIHKTRARWFQERASWPRREPDVRSLIIERNRARTSLEEADTTSGWTLAGPTNIGGRMTAIAVHPTRPDRIWLGGAGGGVWRSDNAGKTWRSLWHDEDSLNIGSLAIDPQNPRVLYCGTGEANLSLDSYPGIGLYRSRNSGASWSLLAPADEVGLPTRIGAIAINPHDNTHLLIGGIGYTPDRPGGLYSSRDGGRTWARLEFVSPHNYWCHAVVFDPTLPGRAYATITEQGSRSGVWRTDDDGTSWTHLTNGLPAPARFHRSSIALAGNHPGILYVVAADARGRVLGVFKSTDGGTTWDEVGGAHFENERQMTYNNTIVIHPDDPELVIVGGVDLHRTTDGGKTWYQVTRWYAERGSPHYAHADHHALAIPAANPDRIYSVNDGGLDVSNDRGRSWRNQSAGLSTTMYYDLDVAQSDGRVYGGGAQDNGTPITTTGSPDDHFDITGGDGGWLVFDPDDANHLVASIYHMNLFRFRSTDGWKDISPPATKDEKEATWMVFVALSPADSRTILTGSQRVWRSFTDGETWSAISPVLDGSPITAIEICRANTRNIYVGTENGGIYRTDDAGQHWSGNLASAALPGHTITRLRSQPDNAAVLYATVANVGHAHVFRSDDDGQTWQDIDQGRLPDAPMHSVEIASNNPGTVWVCGDAGVFVTQDEGATWKSLNNGLPNIMVVDIVHHVRDQTLTVATYGRSLWRLCL